MTVPVWTSGREKNAPADDFGVIRVRIVPNAIKVFVKIVKKLKKKKMLPAHFAVRQGPLQTEIELKEQPNPCENADNEERINVPFASCS